uniref:4'-phosphopantetheine phosphatase n=2 Tax=Nemorhina TaxID=44051 RepID=A0A1B0BSE3_9MUSC
MNFQQYSCQTSNFFHHLFVRTFLPVVYFFLLFYIQQPCIPTGSSMCELHCNVLVKDSNTYQPDTLDLNKDKEAAAYWFPCFRELIEKFAQRALESQRATDTSAEERANQFRSSYLSKLQEYQSQSESHKVLGIRELLELNDAQLRLHGFTDPWQEQKKTENEEAVPLLSGRLQEIDAIKSDRERWLELVRGVLAGNMFDWGAQAVTNILQEDASFGLNAALERIQKRPWLMDDLDAWLQRLQEEEIHKCAAIFVDNSGVDVVLGILPFARELLKRGTKVLLCANSEPSLNDVTSSELTAILDCCNCSCPVLKQACSEKRLLVFGNGQRGPCLDMRTLPQDLCEALKTYQTDLLIIEGMGRALHTNLYARFNCETLKLAVVKNKWLAQRLGGDTFAVICKYEPLTS